jgi:hypothetical protein
MTPLKTNCHNCVNSRSNSFVNSAHIHCSLYWSVFKKYKSSHPKGAEHAKENGWWDFPYDFDPLWMIEECRGYEEKQPLPESKL